MLAVFHLGQGMQALTRYTSAGLQCVYAIFDFFQIGAVFRVCSVVSGGHKANVCLRPHTLSSRPQDSHPPKEIFQVHSLFFDTYASLKWWASRTAMSISPSFLQVQLFVSEAQK